MTCAEMAAIARMRKVAEAAAEMCKAVKETFYASEDHGGNEMTDEQLQELEALEQAATPGPWRVCRNGDGPTYEGYQCEVFQCSGETTVDPLAMDFYTAEDAAIIVAARNALPALLAEVKRLRELAGELPSIEREVREACGHVNAVDSANGQSRTRATSAIYRLAEFTERLCKVNGYLVDANDA